MTDLGFSSPARAALLGAAVLLASPSACGPGASGTCPSRAPAAAAVAQQETAAPEPAEEAPKAAPAASGATAAQAAPAGADGQAGAAPTPGDGRHQITGLTKVGSAPAKFAVVYLEDGPKDPARGMKAVVDQRMMLFIPYVTVVASGGAVTFMNSDPFPHNVFSPSGEKFNIGTLGKGGAGRYVFKAPGAYTLLCNVHPGMIGYVYVAPSSYFAVSDARGRFTMKSVPDGTYKIAAWAPKMASAPQSVTVKGADANVELELAKQ